MNSYKVNPILRTILSDQIDLIQALDRGEAPVAKHWINKIIADLERIKKYLEEK